MNGATFSRVISKPFTAPTATPDNSTTPITSGTLR